jgi:hypothetical protein
MSKEQGDPRYHEQPIPLNPKTYAELTESEQIYATAIRRSRAARRITVRKMQFRLHVRNMNGAS